MEVWDLVNYDPWKRSSEVNNFMHNKGHDASGEDIVLHVRVPCCPSALKDIKLNELLGNLLIELRVRLWLRAESSCRRISVATNNKPLNFIEKPLRANEVVYLQDIHVC